MSYAEQYLQQEQTQNPAQGSGDFNVFTDSWDLISKKFGRGTKQVAKSYFATALAADPVTPVEEKINRLKGFNLDDPSLVADYQAAPWAIRAVSDASEMLPGIGAAVSQGAAVGATNVALGGPINAAALKIPVAGPYVAAVLGAAEFDAGFITGNFSSIYAQSYGEMYGHLIENGSSDAVARTMATSFGSFNAGLELVGLRTLGKLAGKSLTTGGRQAIAKMMASETVKRVEQNTLAKLGLAYAENVITESGTEAFQEFNSNRAEAIANIIERGSWETFDDWDTAINNSRDAFMQAMGASLVLGAAGGGASYTVGKAGGAAAKALGPEQIQQITQALEGMTPTEVFKRANDALRDQPFPWEDGTADNVNFVQNEDGSVRIIQARVSVSEEAAPPAPSPAVEAVAEASGVPVENVQQAAEELGPLFGTQDETQAALDDIFTDAQEDSFAAAETEGRVLGGEELMVDLSPQEAQARRNQLTTDTRVLNKQQRQLEAEFNRKEKTGRSTTATLKKLEAVLEAKENVRIEREMLDSGLLTREDVATRTGQQRMSKIAKLINEIDRKADQLVAQKQRYEDKVSAAEAKGVQKGRSAERRAVRELQSQLEQIVNAATQDPKKRARLKAEINKVTTREQFNRAAKRIEKQLRRLIAQDEKKKYKEATDSVIKEIDKILKQAKVRTKGGNPVSSLDADTLKTLQTFKGYLKDQPAAETAINDFMAEHGEKLQAGQQQDIPDAEYSQYQLAAMAYGMKDKSLIELNAIKGNLANWFQEGKAKVAATREALRAQRAQERQIGRESVGVVEGEYIEGKATKEQSRQQFFDSLGARTLGWDAALEFISPNDPNHTIAQLLDTTVAKREFYGNKETTTLGALQTVQQKLLAEDLAIDLQEKMEADTETRFALTYTNAKGVQKQAIYSKAELIDIWMKMQDDDLHDTMRNTDKGNGWTFIDEAPEGKSFEEAVELALTYEDKVVGQALLDFYREYHGRVNGFYREKYGADLPLKDNYSPLQRTGFDVDPGSAAEDAILFSSVLPGAAKSRKHSLLRVVPRNAYNVLAEHIDNWEHFISHDNVIGTIRNVLSDSALRQTVKDRHGVGTLEVLDNYVNRFVRNDPMPSSGSHPMWAALRSDISRSALGVKAVYQMLTQWTAGTALWHKSDPISIVKALPDTILKYGEAESAFRKSTILRQRFREGATYELSQAVAGKGIGPTLLSKITGEESLTLSSRQYDLLSNIMFAGIRYGDASTVRMFGMPLYWSKIQEGMSPEDAMIEVERMVESTQQADSVDQIPYEFARSPMFYTLFGMFRLQPLQLYSHSMVATRDLMAQRTSKSFGKWLWKMATLWTVPGLLFGALKALPSLFMPPTDNENRDKETTFEMLSSMLLGPVNGLPVFGDIIDAAWWFAAKPVFGVDMTYKTKFGGSNVAWDTFFENPKKALESWAKVFDEDDGFTSLDQDPKEVAELEAIYRTTRAIGPLTGLPQQLVAGPVTAANSMSQGDFIGAAFALSGWSPSTIRKRQQEDDTFGSLSLEQEQDTPLIDYDAIFNQAMGDSVEQQPKDDVDYESLFAESVANSTMNLEGAGQ